MFDRCFQGDRYGWVVVLGSFLFLCTWSPEFKGLVGTMRSDMPVTVVLSAQSSWYGSICTCKHCLAGGRGKVQVTIFLYCQDPIEHDWITLSTARSDGDDKTDLSRVIAWCETLGEGDGEGGVVRRVRAVPDAVAVEEGGAVDARSRTEVVVVPVL